MWSDTFMAIERTNWTRLLLWGAASVLLGAILLVAALRGARAVMAQHFSVQLASWGSAQVVYAILALHTLAERDLAGAATVAGWSRLALVASLCVASLGAVLAVVGRVFKRSDALLGSGTALVVQGVALAALQLAFLHDIARATAG